MLLGIYHGDCPFCFPRGNLYSQFLKKLPFGNCLNTPHFFITKGDHTHYFWGSHYSYKAAFLDILSRTFSDNFNLLTATPFSIVWLILSLYLSDLLINIHLV